MKRYIFFLLLAFAPFALFAQNDEKAKAKGGYDDFRASMFESFKKSHGEMKGKYDTFRSEAIKGYIDFVRKAWESQQGAEPVPAPEIKPVPPVVRKEDDERQKLLQKAQEEQELLNQKEQELRKERELMRQRELELQRQKEEELQRQKEEELKRQKELELQRQKELELQRQKEEELQRQKELELQRQKELELQRQRELELQRQKELELQRQKEEELKRQKELELLRQKELELQRQKEQEQLKKKELEELRKKELELQKQKELELQRQKEEELKRQKELELLRQKELELQRQKEEELKRQREIELQRQKEQELLRQKDLELQRQKDVELKRQKELELQRQKELELQRQRELELQREQELLRQKEEELKRQKELEEQKRKEQAKPVEMVLPPFNVKPQPKPIEPIVVEPSVFEKYVDFAVFGTPVKVRYDVARKVKLAGVDENSVADAMQAMVSPQTDKLIVDCIEVRDSRALSDWAYIQMLKEMTTKIYGSYSNSAVLLMAYVYMQSGYKMRLATNENKLYMLFATEHTMFGKEYYFIDGNKYYSLEELPQKLNICKAAWPGEESLSLLVAGNQGFEDKAGKVKHMASMKYKELSVDVAVNNNMLDFYSTYPKSMLNNNILSTWAMYANVSMDSSVVAQVYPVLKKNIEGLSTLQAVNKLLDFVQTGLVYEYDNVVWGCDRPFFPEESLYYEYADCEDRSILFTRLVRDLLGIEAALIYVPGHLLAAVRLGDDIKGEFILVDGRKFMLCEPTCLNGAPVGWCDLPEDVQMQAILLN